MKAASDILYLENKLLIEFSMGGRNGLGNYRWENVEVKATF